MGILATMGVVNYRGAVIRSYQREAQSNLRLIQQAEETFFLENNAYVSCSVPDGGGTNCNTELHLALNTANWQYIVAADNVAVPPTFSVAAGPRSASAGDQVFHINRGENEPTEGCGDVPDCGGIIDEEPPPEEPPA